MSHKIVNYRPRSRLAVGISLAIFLILILIASFLGDGFNQWSPWSPKIDSAVWLGVSQTGADLGTDLVLKDTLLNASIRFSFTFFAVILLSVFSVFAAIELNKLIFEGGRASLVVLITTFLFGLYFVSLSYLVPLLFFDSKNTTFYQDATLMLRDPRYIGISFQWGSWLIDDGHSFSLFGLFMASSITFVISLIADIALLGYYRLLQRKHIVSLLLIHLLVEFGLFSASYIAAIRGWTTLLLISLIAISTDTFAYFFGKRFGHEKLIASVSFNKTWAGAVYGVLSCVVIIMIFILLYSIPTFQSDKLLLQLNPEDPNYYYMITPQYYDKHNLITNLFVISFFGTGPTFRVYWWIATIMIVMVMSMISIAGDLIFSFIKRSYKIKDFSNLLGSHGGILDRIDSFSTVFFIYFIYLLAVFGISGRSLLNPDAYVANITPLIPPELVF